MKVKQYKCSGVLRYNGNRPDHCKRLRLLLGLKPYTNKKDGCFFFGCYNESDRARILTHKGNVILYWGGTDIIKARKSGWKFSKKILHVVGNKRCKRELEGIGINPIVRPICEIDPSKFKLKPLGRKVFCYMPYKRRGFYGIGIVSKVAKRFPKTTFILTRWGNNRKPFKNAEVHPLVNFEKMNELYRQSFCGLRPVKHDGNPQTCVELGLQGRATGWTYGTSFQPACKTVQDYCNFIELERIRKKPHKEIRQYYLKTFNNFDFIR